MKVTPIAASNAVVGENALGSEGRVSANRLAAAKAIAAGQTPPTVEKGDTKVASATPSITMNTQQSTDRREAATIDTGEAPQAPVETEQPLDPQLARIAKYKRELQVMEKELAALKAAKAAEKPAEDWKVRWKQDPLSALQEAGVTYDDLTQAILSNSQSPDVLQLKKEIKDLREGIDKSFTERETAAEKQVMAQMEREIAKLTSEGDAFETIRATKSEKDVLELIHRTWKSTGEVLTESEACQLIEAQLVEELKPLTSLSKLKPTQAEPQGTKTLTNRDTARIPNSRRERALAAFYGK